MKFIFPGEPIAKERHRSAISNGKIRTYDKQQPLVHANKIELMAMVNYGKIQERTEIAQADYFDIELKFYLPYPKKLGKRKIKRLIEGFEYLPANSKPDIDNLIKFYLDVGNGILYKDDKEIICIKASKCYSLNPKTEFTITPHKGII